MRPKGRPPGRCAKRLRGLSTESDGARVVGYREVNSAAQRKQDVICVRALRRDANTRKDLWADATWVRCRHIDVDSRACSSCTAIYGGENFAGWDVQGAVSHSSRIG